MVQIHLKRSQFGSGSDIVVGVTGTAICPVSAMVDNLQASRDLDPEGRTVPKPWFVNRIREVLSAIGILAHQYAGHSFRIGAATTAAMAGISDSTIQTLGRWHSTAFLLELFLTAKDQG